MHKIDNKFDISIRYTKGKNQPKIKASVDDKDFYEKPDTNPITIKSDEIKDLPKMVVWGSNNKWPFETFTKVSGNPILSSGIQYLITAIYGEGILPCKISRDTKGNIDSIIPAWDDPDIKKFFSENDINLYALEAATDISMFNWFVPEIILNRDDPAKILYLSSKETGYSRWSEKNPNTGNIDWHFYSAMWASTNSPKADDVVFTKVLNNRNPLNDLKVRFGIAPDPLTGKTNNRPNVNSKLDHRFILKYQFPTPMRPYYPMPYWYSVITSGWNDLAEKMVAFKKSLMDNQMSIKYHIQLSEDYFKKIFQNEGIPETDKIKRAERIKKEYTDLENFLCGVNKTGQSVISFIRYAADGRELCSMKITPIENPFKGGEYLEDIEEISNIESYGMGVHPSLIGNSPGKTKTINGTEARELFMIKQAMLKPIRDIILKPLYLIRDFNGWDSEIQFIIPNVRLTTLDDNKSGAEKVTAQPAQQ